MLFNEKKDRLFEPFMSLYAFPYISYTQFFYRSYWRLIADYYCKYNISVFVFNNKMTIKIKTKFIHFYQDIFVTILT